MKPFGRIHVNREGNKKPKREETRGQDRDDFIVDLRRGKRWEERERVRRFGSRRPRD